MVTLTSSYVQLNKMHFYAHHGVMPQERLTGANFTVSLRVKYNLLKAAQTDCVDHTVNYACLYELTKTEMLKPSALLENAAWRIAQSIVNHLPQIEAIDITLSKDNPPMGGQMDGAAVELHLTNEKTI